MGLQLILGGSGSGKSTYARAFITKQSRMHPDRNYIFLVPEQFTMRTQLDLVMEQENRGILNIDVLSFNRLAYRIMEEAGQENARILTETGKSLILRRIAIDRRDELGILGRKLDRSGYVAEVKSALSEFAQYRIDADRLEEMISLTKSRPALQVKLMDLKILQEAFGEYLSQNLLTGEGLLEKLALYAPGSDLLKNSTLVLDGFTGFTPIQMNVLRVLMKVCPDVVITVTIDASEDPLRPAGEHELFALSKKTVGGLYRTAADEGVKIIDPVIMDSEGKRFEPGSELAHLEKNLFRPGTASFDGGGADEAPQIILHRAASPAREAMRAAVLVRELVDEEKYDYEDIALIVGDMPSYQNQIRRFFAMYHIPVFIDRKLDLMFNPCLEFVRGAMEMVSGHFSYESTFRFLRTGFTGIEDERIDLAENYVLAAGISSKAAWTREWTSFPDSMDAQSAISLEQTRSMIMEKLDPFLELFMAPRAKVADYAKALENLLESFGVKEQLETEAERLKTEGYPDRAQEYLQIYETVMKLLSEAALLLGEEIVKQTEARVGIIPPSRSRVQVGDLLRSRLEHVKVLIFLGMNDGWVPMADSGGGIMSELDRLYLTDAGIELAPGERENSYIQRFYLYLCLTKPSRALHIFRSTNTGDGKVLRPSYMVEVLREMFPDAPDLTEPEPGTDLKEIASARTAEGYLAGIMQNSERRDAALELLALLREHGYEREADALVNAACKRAGRGAISADLAKALYGEQLEGSVTRLESYAECAGRHFLDYGLRLREREVREVTAADMGSVFHQALQLFSARLGESGIPWRETDRQKQEEILDTCVDQAIDQCRRGIFRESAINEQLSDRIRRIARRTVWALVEQVKAGEFEPALFERRFKVGLERGDVKVSLNGRIDRVDIWENEGKRYVKVVDYKSGSTGLDLSELFFGLKLQLAVYMDAAVQMEKKRSPGKEVLPGAMFYAYIQDPVVDVKSDVTESEIGERLLRELRPDGLFVESETVINALDRMMSGNSLVIPAGRKTDGSLSAASKSAAPEAMDRLLKYVRGQILDLADGILDGNVDKKPCRSGTRAACEYCPFAGYCGFDPKLPGTAMRQLPSLSKQEFWTGIFSETEVKKDDSLD